MSGLCFAIIIEIAPILAPTSIKIPFWGMFFIKK